MEPSALAKDSELEQTMKNLLSIDIHKITEKEALEIASKTKSVLNKYKIPKDHKYRIHLASFVAGVRAHSELLASKNPELKLEDFMQYGREYAGNIAGHRLIITPSRVNLFIGKMYRNSTFKGIRSVRLGWRFNIAGRIDFTDFILPINRYRDLLIAICGYEAIPSRWQSHPARYYELPDVMPIVDPIFEEPLSVEQYQSLLQWGHDTVRSLNEYIKGNKEWESACIKPQSKPLSELVKDKSAKYMIKRAAELEPKIELCKTEGIFVVKYYQKK